MTVELAYGFDALCLMYHYGKMKLRLRNVWWGVSISFNVILRLKRCVKVFGKKVNKHVFPVNEKSLFVLGNSKCIDSQL